MSIRVRGTISIQRKNSSRGAFNVGDLATEIGEFEVKDSLIEEFEPGKYTGEFLIKWIAPDSFSWRGRVFVKNRATLEEIFVDEADEGAPAPAAPPEPDPLENAPPVASTPAAAADAQPVPADRPSAAAADRPGSSNGDTAAPARSRGDSGDSADLELFGQEIHAQLAQTLAIKLDPTVDRQQFRTQRDRLKALGYQFDAKSQTWMPKAEG